ncbi:hypothetical protein PIB30_000399 [Stylosanthes scabra]|uniref:Uncharacterized protein n=1 Tax=Stylosanthes scabra TaxID=79078 RepID=A0ABU6U178_9FABA|nr:hypothetical protein [Stylosanthes scabra]
MVPKTVPPDTLAEDDVHKAGKGSPQSSCARERGRGRAAPNSEISNVIGLMLDQSWIMYSGEKFTWPKEEKKQISKAYIYREGRRYQQIMSDIRGCFLSRLMWLSEMLKKQLLVRFETDEGVLRRFARAVQEWSLDRPPTEPELFGETHKQNHDRSVKEKRVDDLLTEFAADFERATQQAQEEGDESAGTMHSDVVWSQTLSEPYKIWIYGDRGFFAGSLRTSSYGGSYTSAANTQAGPTTETEAVDLRE